MKHGHRSSGGAHRDGTAGDGNLARALAEWGDYVRGETLAELLEMGAPPEGAYVETVALDGAEVVVGVARR